MKLIKKAYLVDPLYRWKPPLIVFFYDLFSLIRITISVSYTHLTLPTN